MELSEQLKQDHECADFGRALDGYSDRAQSLEKQVSELNNKLDPRQWTQEMHDAWHKNLPDVQAAFNALRELDT